MEFSNKMNFQEFKNLKAVFVIVGIIVLASIAVWFNIDTLNKIKEGRYIGKEIETKNTITVSGKGEIYAKPNLALVNFSVVTEKKTVAEAISENTKKMNAVINSIKKQGVEDKDLKTTIFNIYPRYEYTKGEKEIEIYPYPSGKRILVGYEVNQTLEVKIRDLAKIGDIIQGATEAGANQVGDLQFIIDQEDELKSAARKEAIEKAKQKAKEISDQLGVKLVRIINFNESSVSPPFPVPYMAREASGLGGAETPQIETGENKIEVTVSITYEID